MANEQQGDSTQGVLPKREPVRCGLVSYPIVIRHAVAELRLPADFSKADLPRVVRYLEALVSE